MAKPPAAARPQLLVVAFRLWLTGAALTIAAAIAVAVLSLTVGDSAVADTVLVAIFLCAIGIAVILMARRVYAGDQRMRGVLAIFTVTWTALAMVGSVLLPALAWMLILAVAMLVGSIMAYRPAVEEWFAAQPGRERA